jgi:hypothetical protein
VIPALSSSVINAWYKGDAMKNSNYIANIFALRILMVSGMPAIVTIDIDILHKHQAAISIKKYNLGLAKNFTHKIHLKNQD